MFYAKHDPGISLNDRHPAVHEIHRDQIFVIEMFFCVSTSNEKTEPFRLQCFKDQIK
jgi:hypothetical protein